MGKGGGAPYPATARRAVCAVPDIDFVRSPERYTKKRLAPSGPTRVYDRGRSRERRGHFATLRVFYAPFLCRGGVLRFLVAELHVA